MRRDWFVRKLFVRSCFNAVAHAFVCNTHAVAVSLVGLLQACVKHMVALAAAVERLLADVLLFQFAFDRQHGRSCVPTQHWKIFVSEILWFVL